MFKTRMIKIALMWVDNVAKSKNRKTFGKYKKVVGEFEMPAKIYNRWGL